MIQQYELLKLKRAPEGYWPYWWELDRQFRIFKMRWKEKPRPITDDRISNFIIRNYGIAESDIRGKKYHWDADIYDVVLWNGRRFEITEQMDHKLTSISKYAGVQEAMGYYEIVDGKLTFFP